MRLRIGTPKQNKEVENDNSVSWYMNPLFFECFHYFAFDLVGEVWVVTKDVLSRIATLSEFVAIVAIP